MRKTKEILWSRHVQNSGTLGVSNRAFRVEVAAVDNTLINFQQARQALGLSPRVLNWRVNRAGVQVFIDGRDRRRRMLDARDLPKLILHEPVRKPGEARQA